MNSDWVMWLHESRLESSAPEEERPVGLVDYIDEALRFLNVLEGLEDHVTGHSNLLTLDWEFAPFGRSDYALF